jgi:putative zinc finger/helix-turn-helix YgiT family protein
MNRPERGRKPYPWRCGKCRETAVYAGVTNYELDLDFDDRTYHIKLPRLKTPRCRKCGTVLLDTPANEKITAEFLRQARLLAPARIRAYRERLGISQKELASAIGVAEETVADFESGMRFQQRPVDNMLRLFFGSPEARELLTNRKLSRVGLVTKTSATTKAAG